VPLFIHSIGAVAHAAEIPYVYGQVPPTAGAASQNLSLAMMDYWISFTVSLDPNDGKGVERECLGHSSII
jgi:carboxylesterase type B